MAHNRLSVAFWIVILILFGVFDVFGTPIWMNHFHGLMRWVGLGLSGLTLVPILALLKRIYGRVRVFLLTKGI